jgi:threonine synthase
MTSFVSTRGSGPVSFTEALMAGLSPDGGLYVPESIGGVGAPGAEAGTFAAVAGWVARAMLGDGVAEDVLAAVVKEALDFPVPLVEIEDGVHVLELFHGPTLAFKDVGARFMARAMVRLAPAAALRTVLVATSGDTGGAVASAFHGLDGYRVVALFPLAGVSELQRRQMTTLGGNVVAVGVRGSFDDCQRLTKLALADPGARDELGLTSANSVNVARLIPQSFYYVAAALALGWRARPVTFVVPAGNLGNLCAGLLAKRAGMPAARFVAATNANDAFPEYLRTRRFSARTSVRTLSTAMDVGDPSNLERIRWLYRARPEALFTDVLGARRSDDETLSTIAEVHGRTGYVLDPHTAVAYGAWHEHARAGEGPGVVLATAHPAKFPDVVEAATGERLPPPEPLARVLDAPERYRTIEPDVAALLGLLSVGSPA